MSESNDSSDDSGVVWIFAEIAYKGTINLQSINRKSFQIIQRGIARPKVVNRNFDPHHLQLEYPLDRFVRILHDRTFGYLQLEPCRIQIRLLQYFFDTGNK